MKSVLEKVEALALLHDKIDPKLVREKNIKLGLRNEDGTGVFVGITSKGQVIGYEKVIHGDGTEKVNPVPGKLYYCGYDVEDLVAGKEREGRFGFDETVYLLLTGELPLDKDLRSFSRELTQKTHSSHRSERDDHVPPPVRRPYGRPAHNRLGNAPL